MATFKKFEKIYRRHLGDVFKKITTDNGSEFPKLSILEEIFGTLVYYAHPYAYYENSFDERYNLILRKFIPIERGLTTTHEVRFSILKYGVTAFYVRFWTTRLQMKSSKQRLIISML